MALLVALGLIALAALAGVLIGWGMREWRYAEEAARLHDSVRAGTRRIYSTTRDGRNADNLPPGRYAGGDR